MEQRSCPRTSARGIHPTTDPGVLPPVGAARDRVRHQSSSSSSLRSSASVRARASSGARSASSRVA